MASQRKHTISRSSVIWITLYICEISIFYDRLTVCNYKKNNLETNIFRLDYIRSIVLKLFTCIQTRIRLDFIRRRAVRLNKFFRIIFNCRHFIIPQNISLCFVLLTHKNRQKPFKKIKQPNWHRIILLKCVTPFYPYFLRSYVKEYS